MQHHDDNWIIVVKLQKFCLALSHHDDYWIVFVKLHKFCFAFFINHKVKIVYPNHIIYTGTCVVHSLWLVETFRLCTVYNKRTNPFWWTHVTWFISDEKNEFFQRKYAQNYSSKWNWDIEESRIFKFLNFTEAGRKIL